MAKSGLKFEISERDKKLLILLVAVIILVAAYMLGYQKFSEKTKNYEAELAVVKNEILERQEDINNKERYLEITEKNTVEYNAILAQYGTDITQPGVIDFLNKLERVNDAWVKSVSFSGTTPIYTFGAGEYSTDLVGYETQITLSYTAEYDEWKSLLGYLNSYYSKNTIDTISMTYNDVTNVVSGSMNLSLYSVVGGDRPASDPDFDIDTGSDNIFSTDNSVNVTFAETGDYILSDYDLYIIASPASTAMESCIIGCNYGESADSALAASSTGIQKVSITVEGAGNIYKATYSIDGVEKSFEFKSTNTLDLLIMSSARTGLDDLSGIELSVNNKADKTLNFKVFNDDSSNPRVVIKSLDGDVSVH